MFEKIIQFSVRQKFIITLFVVAIIAGGLYSLSQLPIDAVPDITNNQVQVVTTSPTLAPQEVEQLITFPIEVSVANIPRVEEIRSISRYGLSVITIVFDEGMPQLDARQFVQEQLKLATEEIPDGLGSPELMPITTGLGEIYQYTLEVEPGYESQYSAMELRTIQDWIVKRQMAGISGIIEISSFGGYLKQYEVAVDPLVLRSFDLTLADIFEALENNNQNSGSSYIEKSTNAYYIRSEGRINSLDDIEKIIVKHQGESPVMVRDVANVQWGSPKRYGALTHDGKGEAVGGIALMLKGANSSDAIANVHERVERVQQSLPEGVKIVPYLDRSDLVGRAINTVSKNLIEGGLIVIFVLLLLLGNWRAGLIVASVIPLAMLFAFILMNLFGVSANLMSLGAIDFGIVVDGAVIIVENALHVLYTAYLGKKLTQRDMDDIITQSSSKIYQSAAFGVLIILVVFLPVITLTGVEGKMFKPMALTVSFALLGALILSLTYVPMITSLILKKHIKEHKTFSDKMVDSMRNAYQPLLRRSLQWPKLLLSLVAAAFLGSVALLGSLGAEFIPTLEEGDLAMQMTIPPGSSLQQSIKTANKAEQILLDNFPEVKHVVSKIGTSEVPTDPMAIEDADIMIILKEKADWTTTQDREELVGMMKDKLARIPGVSFEFTQPIQLRFNELTTGAKTDVAIKIFGEDVNTLASLGEQVAQLVEGIQGAADVKVEQTDGLTQYVVRPIRAKLAQHNVNISDVNQVIRTAYAGETAGVIFENEKKFDLVVRLDSSYRQSLNLNRLFVNNAEGDLIPLEELVRFQTEEGPMQITRENAQRRISIGVNVRNRDIASLVAEIEEKLNAQLPLPAGYYVTYGGQFENLEAAQQRLSIAVPVALLMIFMLLYFAFGSMKYAVLIFSAVPMSAIGGIVALWLRGMPFSISAGIGFIALFGVAVLNGIVLISYFNELRNEGKQTIDAVVIAGALARLRPVLMTAAVAALGFLPMAISTTAGAEVQKPLATVVIGGLVSSTLLTLFILPNLYVMFNKKVFAKAATVLVLFIAGFSQANAQTFSLQQAIDSASVNHAAYKNLDLALEQSLNNEKATFKLGNTSFNYTFGQINDDYQDWQWQLDQDLGNLFLMGASKKLMEANTDQVRLEQVIKKNLLDYQVQESWFNWYFSYQKQSQYNIWLPKLNQVSNSLQQAFELGEIAAKDKLSIENLLIKLRQEALSAAKKLNESKATLSTWTGNEQLERPTSINLDAFLLQANDSLANVFHQKNEAELNALDLKVRQEKSKRLPEFSVGYFNQQIVGTRGLNGFRAGIGIPLFSAQEKRNAQNATIQKQIQSNEQTQTMAEYQQQLKALKANKKHLQASLDVLPSEAAFASQWQVLVELLESGEINLFEWTSLLNSHIENYAEQLSIQQQLINTQLQINFLTQQ